MLIPYSEEFSELETGHFRGKHINYATSHLIKIKIIIFTSNLYLSVAVYMLNFMSVLNFIPKNTKSYYASSFST